MPYNGNGVFVRLYNWVQDAANSIQIVASRMDNETQGIADGLTNCLTRDGQSPPTANIPMGNKKITGLANGSSSGDAVSYDQVFGSNGSSNVGFIQSGVGAVARTAQDKLRDTTSPEDFGAVGDGVTDDSAAFVAALASHNVVECNGSKYYKLKNLTLTNNQTIDFNGARVTAAAGATYIVKLTNYAANITNFYIPDATACSEAAIVFDNGRFCGVSNGTILNSTTAISLKATVAATGCIKPYINDVNIEGFTVRGIYLQPNVAQLEATDVFVDQGGASGVGIDHNSTGSIIAHGGHTYNNVRAEGCNIGWKITNGTLTEIEGGWADTSSDTGMIFYGACDHINIRNFFIGTSTNKGLVLHDTAKVYVDGLEMYAATDTVEVFDTAELIMDIPAWRGNKSGFAVASGAKFTPVGADIVGGTSVGTIAVSTNTFLGINAVQATEADTGWVMPYDGYIIGIYGRCTVTPVTTHVYTARKGAADTTIVSTINPASFAAGAWGAVPAVKGDMINARVTTSTTNASRHSVQIVIASS